MKCIVTEYYYGDELQDDEMGGSQDICGREHKWQENLKKRDHAEDLDMSGRMKLRWILKKYDERTCTGLGQGQMPNNGTLVSINTAVFVTN